MARSSDPHVSMVFHKPVTKLVWRETEACEFKPKGRWAWLQKLAWRFLQRSEVLHKYRFQDETVSYKRLTFNKQDVIENLFKAQQTLADIGYKPRRILVGPEDMMEIMGNRDFMQLAIMNHTTEFEAKLGYNRTLFGIPVEIVPHMKGVLIL